MYVGTGSTIFCGAFSRAKDTFWGIISGKITKFHYLGQFKGIHLEWLVDFGVSFSRRFTIFGSDFFRCQMAHPRHPPIELTPRRSGNF